MAAEGDEKALGAGGAGAIAEPPAVAARNKKELIQSFFRRAHEFTDELLHENERLRFRLAELEELNARRAEGPPSPATLGELAGRIHDLEREREQLAASHSAVERQNLDFASRSREIDREHESLANLYVALFRLHSTLDLGELTRTIVEILINLVGARTFAVLLHDRPRGLLRTLAAEGIARDEVPALSVAEGPGESAVSRAVRSGAPHYDERGGSGGAGVDLGRPIAVVPLRLDGRSAGAVVIWDLLPQKSALVDVDFELFEVLAAHAAPALLGAKLLHDVGPETAALWNAVDLV